MSSPGLPHPNGSPPEVVPADVADAGALSQLIADAFHDLPQSCWLIPDQDARRAIMPGYFRIYVDHALANGVVHTTPGRAGVALWLPVGVHPPAPGPDYAARLAAATQPWTDRFRAFDATLDCHHPAAPHTTTSPSSPSTRAGKARASAPRCCARTTPPSMTPACPPTWKPPACARGSCTCAMGTRSSPMRRSTCPAAGRRCGRYGVIPALLTQPAPHPAAREGPAVKPGRPGGG